MRLQGRSALVTGGAQGIGLAVAQNLASEGAAIAILDRDIERSKEAAESLPSALTLGCDVRNRDQIEEGLVEIEAVLGPVDILVNSAGIWRHTPVLEVDEAGWDEVFEVNVKGLLFCSQVIATGMARRGEGKIVNIASMAGFTGISSWSAYCASKAAVISLTLALAAQLKEGGVHVNAVCPGGTRTSMSEYITQVEGASDLSFYHDPEEVAGLVTDLICPFDQSTSGCIIPMSPIDTVLGIGV